MNRCCMCHRNEETVDHLLLYCPVVHSLWVYMYQIFGIQWVMLCIVGAIGWENLIQTYGIWFLVV